MRLVECPECHDGRGYAGDHCDNCGCHIESTWDAYCADELPPEWAGMHIITTLDLSRQSHKED